MEQRIRSMVLESIKTKNPFSTLVTKIYDASVNPGLGSVYNISFINKKDKMKGEYWEYFCKMYLESTGNYSNVYLIKDIPKNIGLTSNDIGIDIVCQTNSGKYVAVQCKYRYSVKRELKVSWSNLSTFIAACESKCSEWKKYIVMTNCRGVNWKGKKGKKYKTIAMNTFSGLNKEQWYSIVGLDLDQMGRKLGDKERNDTKEDKEDGSDAEEVSKRDKMIRARLLKFKEFI